MNMTCNMYYWFVLCMNMTCTYVLLICTKCEYDVYCNTDLYYVLPFLISKPFSIKILCLYFILSRERVVSFTFLLYGMISLCAFYICRFVLTLYLQELKWLVLQFQGFPMLPIYIWFTYILGTWVFLYWASLLFLYLIFERVWFII